MFSVSVIWVAITELPLNPCKAVCCIHTSCDKPLYSLTADKDLLVQTLLPESLLNVLPSSLTRRDSELFFLVRLLHLPLDFGQSFSLMGWASSQLSALCSWGQQTPSPNTTTRETQVSQGLFYSKDHREKSLSYIGKTIRLKGILTQIMLLEQEVSRPAKYDSRDIYKAILQHSKFYIIEFHAMCHIILSFNTLKCETWYSFSYGDVFLRVFKGKHRTKKYERNSKINLKTKKKIKTSFPYLSFKIKIHTSMWDYTW